MQVSEKILERCFEGKTTKEAYLKCCKWISTNIIAVNNSEHITYKIEKVRTEDFEGKIKLTLYVVIDEEEIIERHCNICKEATGAFFMKQNKYMCETCRMIPYRKRIKEKIELVKEGLKGKIL